MLIDSHCHLDYLELQAYEDGLSGLLQASQDAGVSGILSVAVQRANIDEVIALAAGRARVWASVGIHPLHADEAVSEAELLAWSSAPGVVAIGETGLDYHYDSVSPECQRESFRRHLRAAAKARLPVIVHTREARDDTLQIIAEEADQELGGVLHCFTESWEMAEAAIELNFYVSISGIVTFSNATALRDVVRRLPLDRLLIETDAPYLAPVPHRGKANEPRYLPEVARCVAGLRGLGVEEIAEISSANFFRLFPRAAP